MQGKPAPKIYEQSEINFQAFRRGVLRDATPGNKKSNSMKTPINKVLIFSPNWIGDVVMSSPIVNSIKTSYPNSHIVMIANSYVFSLWESNVFIDELWRFDAVKTCKNMLECYQLFKKIRQRNFNTAIILSGNMRFPLIAFLAGIKRRLGFGARCNRIFLTDVVKYNRRLKNKHMVDVYSSILGCKGSTAGVKELSLKINDADADSANMLLKENGITPEDLLVGVAPGAIYGKTKRWPKENYAKLSDEIIEKHHAKIVIFTAPSEQEITSEVKSLMRNKPIVVDNATNLRVIACLIKRCAVLITNDSGLMHIAAAVKTNTVAIFGSTSPAFTGPYGDSHIILKKSISCSPCFKKACPFNTYECLASITTEEAFSAVDFQLKRICCNA